MKKITNVFIEPGCVSCGTCQMACPEVFEVKGTAHIKQGTPLDKHEENIRKATSLCPVNLIQIQEEESC